MNTRIIALCGWLLSLTAIFLTAQDQPPKRSDIIKFSHKRHLLVIEAMCTDCHQSAVQSTLASDNIITTMADCENCHEIEDEESCTNCHYKDEDTWLPFESLDRKVNYSHKLHMDLGELECETCHKNMTKIDYSTAQSMAVMKDCILCHDDSTAQFDCALCHQLDFNLRPVTHSPDFFVAHKSSSLEMQSDCANCHNQKDCFACHDAGSLFAEVEGGKFNIQARFASDIGGTGGLNLEHVHEEGFVESHETTKKAQLENCASCHDAELFCETCHDSSPAWIR